MVIVKLVKPVKGAPYNNSFTKSVPVIMRAPVKPSIPSPVPVPTSFKLLAKV